MLERPIRLWVLFLAAVTLIGVTAKALVPELLSGPAGVSPLQVALQAVMLLMVLPFAIRVGKRGLGLGAVRRPQGYWVLLFPALTVAFGYSMGFREVPPMTLLLALASVALAGVVEELAFRGVLLGRLLPRGVWPAVAISSTLFGLMHLSNLALGSPWYSVLLQVTFAGMAGTGYAAMRLRTGSLWPPIVLHAAFDLTFRVAVLEPGTMFANAVQMLHGVGWLIYALSVFRRSRRSELFR
jgi:membrane protease YdiL (CAAX protease family)